jgi:spore germination protein GerM
VTRRLTLIWIGLGLTAVLLVWLLVVVLPGWYAPEEQQAAAAPTAEAPEGSTRKINATLFYITSDGLQLVGVEREVPFAEGTTGQARRIVEEQLKAAPSPNIAAVPAGTALRSLFVTERGDAFVDLSGEVTSGHTGGSLDELFTVYAIVNALTVNLPAVTGVQILVNGREVDTLAGHVDLRHPLRKNLSRVKPAPGE